jgi:ATP-dependent Clp protease ATP-binding subunit ClpC
MPNKMERFTQRARHVLYLANQEAERYQHAYIGTEHLLLGLMREENGIAGRVLRDLGLELGRIDELVQRLTHAPAREGDTRMDLSPGVKKVLELAVDEARRMGHHYIGTEHLLLAIARQNEGIAIEVLKRLGISPEELRRQTRRVLQEGPAAPPTEAQTSETSLQNDILTLLSVVSRQGKPAQRMVLDWMRKEGRVVDETLRELNIDPEQFWQRLEAKLNPPSESPPSA